MAVWEANRGAREARIEALHEQLTGAVEQLGTGADWRRALEFAAHFRSCLFNNTLLIWMQHAAAFEAGRVPDPMPSYVAGFKQWLALGSVMRGQSGYMIYAPVTGRFASFTPLDAESWRRLERGEQPAPGEVMRSKMVGVKPAYVWDISQTTGDPIPEAPRPTPLIGEAPAGVWDGLTELVRQDGFTVGTVANARSAVRTASPTTSLARCRYGRTRMPPRRSRRSRTSWRTSCSTAPTTPTRCVTGVSARWRPSRSRS